MKCTIDGQEVSTSLLMCRPMNFGQPVLNLSPLKYWVSIDMEDFLSLISRIYKEFITEEMEDDSDELGEWPDLDRLRTIGYPSLEFLVEKETILLEAILKQFLETEILDVLFPFSQDISNHRYTINTLDSITIQTPQVFLEGEAYIL